MHNQFSSVSDILNDIVFDRTKINFSVKKAVAFGFWKDITGARFEKFSAPYDIKGKTLYVAVKNPQVMQELLFCKEKLLKKINDYFLPLDIQIFDIKYDYKIWNNFSGNFILDGDDSIQNISKTDIENTPLSEFEMGEFSNVTNTISKCSFMNEELKSKYKNNIINSIKAKKIRQREI